MRKLATTEINRKSTSEFKESGKTRLIIVLDNVRSALNVGSIFRTADAFLIEAVYLCGITAYPPNREIQKTALGAAQNVSWKFFEKCEDAIAELKKMNCKIIAIEQTDSSVKLNDLAIPRDETLAVVFGNEVTGIDQHIIQQSHLCIEIPQYGTKHSLNIAVCVGIVVWDLFVKIKYSP